MPESRHEKEEKFNTRKMIINEPGDHKNVRKKEFMCDSITR